MLKNKESGDVLSSFLSTWLYIVWNLGYKTVNLSRDNQYQIYSDEYQVTF